MVPGFLDFDQGAVESNAKEHYEDSPIEDSEWAVTKNFKNLWRVINHDMDEQSVSSAINDVRDASEEKQDLEKIQDYINSVKQLNALKNKLETKQYTNVKEQQDDIDLFQNLSNKITEYDNYFMGEGRTHKVIADNMFDGAKMSAGESYSTTWDMIKRGWNKQPQLGLSRYGIAGSLVGGAIEGVMYPIAGVTGVAGEIVSGAYNEAKDLIKKVASDQYSNASKVNEYIRNFSNSDDELLKRLYLGRNVVNREGQDKDLSEKLDEATRRVNKRIVDLQEAQHDLKNANLFRTKVFGHELWGGINGAYNYDAVSEDWLSGRKEYQDGSFWGAFVHPFYATADIASSLDMMKY